MARPKIVIDPAKVEELAAIGATNAEIASYFGCSIETLRTSYLDFLDKGRNSGKTRLRMLQWTAAKNGNVTMLIWLGKQYLNQTDKQSIDINSLSPEQALAILAAEGTAEADSGNKPAGK